MKFYGSLNIIWHCPFLELKWKLTDSSPVAIAQFLNLLTDLVQHLTASSYRVLNSTPGILSPPIAMFVIMFPRSHLISHSKVSDSRWVTTASRLAGSSKPILISYSMYSCHLFLISSASVKSLLFLSFKLPMLAWNVFLISSIFLKRSLVFPILLFSSISLFFSLIYLFQLDANYCTIL